MVYEDKNTDEEMILIVDDVETNRLVLEEIVKGMGCSPVLAESGEEALSMIREHCPQLILSDISMPGMDGYELCKTLKGNEKTKNIPIIFISAFDDPMDIVEGFLLGGQDYITKPFIPEVVQARVGVHLRLNAVKRELIQMNRRLQVSVSEQLRQMEQEKKNILYALANFAVQNSGYEEKYMEKLGTNCRLLAQGMQLSPLFEDKISDSYVDAIELSAPLCDIGNVGIPREILQEEEGLTEEEVEIIHNHTKTGAKFLKDLHADSDYNDFISIAIDIANYHHENWDGSGYPDGLAGEQIPLAAQIVSIMDEYCTLREKKNCSREEALEIMSGDEGTKFNPDIFKICRKISRQLC